MYVHNSFSRPLSTLYKEKIVMYPKNMIKIPFGALGSYLLLEYTLVPSPYTYNKHYSFQASHTWKIELKREGSRKSCFAKFATIPIVTGLISPSNHHDKIIIASNTTNQDHKQIIYF